MERKNMNRLSFILILFVFIGLKDGVCNQPAWVLNRPTSKTYYIGIAGLQKNICATDCHEQAKQKALKSIVSEISIQVLNTAIYSVSEGKKYQNTYSSQTHSKSEGRIENYELVDVWQSREIYWVYYRLKKSLFWEEKEKQKRRIDSLVIKVDQGLSRQQSSLLNSIKDYQETFIALKNCSLQISKLFPVMKNKYEHQIIKHLNQIKILTSEIKIKNKESAELSNTVQINAKSSIFSNHANYLSGFPIEIVGFFPDTNQRIIFLDHQSTYKQTRNSFIGNKLLICPSYENLGLENSLIIKLEKIKMANCLQVKLTSTHPKIFLISREKNLNKKIAGQPIYKYLIRQFEKIGIKTVDRLDQSDFQLEITAASEVYNWFEDICYVYLNVSIDLLNHKQNYPIFRWSKNRVKGAGLEPQLAGKKAYGNAKSTLKREFIPLLLNNI